MAYDRTIMHPCTGYGSGTRLPYLRYCKHNFCFVSSIHVCFFGSSKHNCCFDSLKHICLLSRSVCPQKSIRTVSRCCFPPTATLCDLSVSLLLFLFGFTIFSSFKLLLTDYLTPRNLSISFSLQRDKLLSGRFSCYHILMSELFCCGKLFNVTI